MSGRRPIEVLVRADRRRFWTVDQKREIVAESFGPELTAAQVARKHGITSGQLYTWRRQLVSVGAATQARPTPQFASVELTPSVMPSALMPASAPPSRSEGLIEIALPGGAVVRVDAHVDGRALRRVLGALSKR